jgi:hypothetical protein
MTIATRPDWNGNAAIHTFEDVMAALDYMKTNPCYEILPENQPVRPYGDIDYKVPVDMTEAEFNDMDAKVFFALSDFFKDHTVTIFSATSYAYRKISHRWVIPDHYVKSVEHAKAFAADLYGRLTFPPGVSGDMSVYSKLRKMRTFWTSKPNENRPFYMLQGEEEDHIISHIPKWAKLIDFDLEPKHEEYKPVCTDYAKSYITQLCDCVAVSSWTDYTTAQSLIFTLLAIGAPSEVIHHYCAKAPNYSYKWVNDYIRRYTPTRNRHTIGTLKHFAKRDNPAMYATLQRDKVFDAQMGRRMFDEMTRLTEDSHTRHDWCDENGFLKPLPQCATLAVKSHLGTGKTRECIRACTPSPWNPQAEKILVMSARQTFTTHITAELKGFVDYRTIKDKAIDADKVVVQLQSLWKCGDMEPRDLVLLDEVESILMSLTPNKTHKRYMETIAAFEKLIRTAKRVIVLDAFLTDRTMEMLRSLRGETLLVINPHCPYKKTATLVSETGLYSTLQKKLNEKTRMVAVWGAKNKAKAFHSVLPSSVKNVLYTGDSNAAEKEKHLADVDTHWANYQLVGYTATITVGINYNGTLFDEECLYATPWSCPSRDYIQALHRARKLKNNHITAYISSDPRPCMFEPGIEEQEAQFKVQTERVKKFLQDIGHQPMDYATLPPWLHRILMWNTNETITNYKHFAECMKGYFRLCGIQYGEDAVEEPANRTKKSDHLISVQDVETIDYETAQIYSRNQAALSETQRYELEKYFMLQKVVKVDDFIWSAWMTDKKQVERSYSAMNLAPEDLIHSRVLDLVPKDAERLKLFQDLGMDWDTRWDKDTAEVPKVDLSLFGQRIRSEKDTTEQYCRDLCKALKTWCGVELKVNRKRTRNGDKLDYAYTLSYEPQDQVFSYMARKWTAREVFADEL